MQKLSQTLLTLWSLCLRGQSFCHCCVSPTSMSRISDGLKEFGFLLQDVKILIFEKAFKDVGLRSAPPNLPHYCLNRLNSVGKLEKVAAPIPAKAPCVIPSSLLRVIFTIMHCSLALQFLISISALIPPTAAPITPIQRIKTQAFCSIVKLCNFAANLKFFALLLPFTIVFSIVVSIYILLEFIFALFERNVG